jgi:4,5-DOPA dioxygenase extradiol
MTLNRLMKLRMHRRHFLATLAAGTTPFMTPLSDAAVQPLIQALKPSPRMPVLFVGHGSPMNAIEDNTHGAAPGRRWAPNC